MIQTELINDTNKVTERIVTYTNKFTDKSKN